MTDKLTYYYNGVPKKKEDINWFDKGLTITCDGSNIFVCSNSFSAQNNETLKNTDSTRHKSREGETHNSSIEQKKYRTDRLEYLKMLKHYYETSFKKSPEVSAYKTLLDIVDLQIKNLYEDIDIISALEDFSTNYHWSRHKTNGAETEKFVHSNPFNQQDYCPKKKRVEDVDKEISNKSWIQDMDTEGKVLNWHTISLPNTLTNNDINTTSDVMGEFFAKFFEPQIKENPYKTMQDMIDKNKPVGDKKIGIKESQTVKKAPIFTYCKQMKNAIEALAFRSEYGHDKYLEFDADYNNFARVPNGDEEYGNASFRHALGIGEDSELDHYIASAWDAVARLEIYLRKDLHIKK